MILLNHRKYERTMSVEDLLGQIQENLLQAVTLGGKEDVLREALSASYGQLGQNERLMFEVCGAFPLRGTVVTRFPAVAGLPLYHCRGALQRLDRLALVEVDERENRDQNIYHMHQVIHAFAREQLVASETRRLADGAAPSETLLDA
jgi:hypothetical protein